MSHSLSTRALLLGLLMFIMGAWIAAPASALSISPGEWSGPAFAGGDPAVATVAIEYDCGQLLPPPLGSEIEVTAQLEEGALGSVSLSESTFTPQMPPDCDPGSMANETLTLTYTATMEQVAESSETIALRVSHNVSGELGEEDEANPSATVGAYLDVTFIAANDTFVVIGGDTITVEIEMLSDSNAEVMGMPELEVPEDWESPRVVGPSVPSPLVEGDGTAVISFDVEVPEEADGENVITFTAWAHTLTDPSVETGTVEIPLTFDVTPLSEVRADEEEGPAPAAFVVVLAVLAAFAVARRRQTR